MPTRPDRNPPTLCPHCGRPISAAASRCRRCASRLGPRPADPPPWPGLGRVPGAPLADADVAWILAKGAGIGEVALARVFGVQPWTIAAVRRAADGEPVDG